MKSRRAGGFYVRFLGENWVWRSLNINRRGGHWPPANPYGMEAGYNLASGFPNPWGPASPAARGAMRQPAAFRAIANIRGRAMPAPTASFVPRLAQQHGQQAGAEHGGGEHDPGDQPGKHPVSTLSEIW